MYYDNEDAGDLGISGAAGASEARSEENEERCNGLHRFGFCKTGEHDRRFMEGKKFILLEPAPQPFVHFKAANVPCTGDDDCAFCKVGESEAKETTSYFCPKCGAKRTVPVEQDNVECQNCGRSLAGLDGEDDN